MAVVAVVRMAREVQDKKNFMNVLLYGGITTFIILLLSDLNHMIGGNVFAAILGGLLFAAITAAISYAVRAAGKTNLRVAALSATLLCLVAPGIMGFQDWNDHDRSQKT